MSKNRHMFSLSSSEDVSETAAEKQGKKPLYLLQWKRAKDTAEF